MSIPRSVVVLGGSGFIGQAVVPAAVAAGIHVLAVARSDTSAAIVAALGAHPVRGDVGSPSGWMAQCAGTDAMVDLTQPDVPARVTVRAIGRMAESRVAMTRAMLEALATLSPSMRPLWISVSGTDDLLPDSSGVLSSRSGLRSAPRGFAHIGLPVRAAIEASNVDATFVYLGQMVYGPGKSYASFVVDGLRTGKAKMVGARNNTLPLTHVDDAAAALVHLLGRDRRELVGRTIVAVPATGAIQRELFALTAAALGRPVPGSVPTALAALVAGRVSAQVMTLDARCDPDPLTATGFTFHHETVESGVAASLAVMTA